MVHSSTKTTEIYLQVVGDVKDSLSSMLGACRIIGIFAQIEANSKKLPEAYTEYSEDNFFEFNEDMGKKGIIRQAPREEQAGAG